MAVGGVVEVVVEAEVAPPGPRPATVEVGAPGLAGGGRPGGPAGTVVAGRVVGGAGGRVVVGRMVGNTVGRGRGAAQAVGPAVAARAMAAPMGTQRTRVSSLRMPKVSRHRASPPVRFIAP
jgi:hypothetical protein